MPIGSFSAIPTPETVVGIAKEVTRGTAVNPTWFLPVMAPKYKPDRQYLPDESLQGSMVQIYDEIPSLRHDTHGWEQYLYLDSFPLLVQAELGSPDNYTVAPSSTTLTADALPGDTSITVAATIPPGSIITFGSGSDGSIESHVTGTVSGAFVVALPFPVINKHLSGATVTALNTHQFSLLNNSPATGNQPPSMTISDYSGETVPWRQLTAAQLDGLNIQGSAEALPKAALNWFANPSITPISNPTPSFTGSESPAGWTAQLILSGSPVAYVVSWEIDLKRNVKPIAAITGTENYWQYFASTLTAAAKFTVLEDFNATWLTAFEEGSTETVDLTVYDVQSGWAINVHSSKAKIISGELDRSKEWLEVPLEMTLLPNTTDVTAGGVSPLTITVGNAHASAY